jgi:CRISPR-associated protein Csb1
MSDESTKYDYLLKEDGPAAIVLKHWLKPVGDAIIFPPTYANPSQKKGDPPVYNIDHSVCVIDSVPSQANRLEPALGRLLDEKGDAVRLVPKAVVKAKVGGESVEVDLLEAGHRAADAVVRLSTKASDLGDAIKSYQKGDAMPLGKLAPTSLVFGMWDSRETGVKVPRLINSIIRAYDVLEHRRSSQFNPAMDFAAAGVVREAKDKELSEVGMDSVPATFKHGGVEARGGICRDAAINLCTLRDIAVKFRWKPDSKPGDSHDSLTPEQVKEETGKLQRYILGLALVAITYFDGKTLNLRQGCQLVSDKDKPMTRVLVNPDGTEPKDPVFDLDRNKAIAFAKAAAAEFVVGPDWVEVEFDVKAANAALKKS